MYRGLWENLTLRRIKWPSLLSAPVGADARVCRIAERVYVHAISKTNVVRSRGLSEKVHVNIRSSSPSLARGRNVAEFRLNPNAARQRNLR